MADRMRIVFNDDAFAELLHSPRVVADLKRRGEAVASAANRDSSWGGYDSTVSSEGNRPHARVWNMKHAASDDESRNNRLLRSLDAARD